MHALPCDATPPCLRWGNTNSVSSAALQSGEPVGCSCAEEVRGHAMQCNALHLRKFTSDFGLVQPVTRRQTDVIGTCYLPNSWPSGPATNTSTLPAGVELNPTSLQSAMDRPGRSVDAPRLRTYHLGLVPGICMRATGDERVWKPLFRCSQRFRRSFLCVVRALNAFASSGIFVAEFGSSESQFGVAGAWERVG